MLVMYKGIVHTKYKSVEITQTMNNITFYNNLHIWMKLDGYDNWKFYQTLLPYVFFFNRLLSLFFFFCKNHNVKKNDTKPFSTDSDEHCAIEV